MELKQGYLVQKLPVRFPAMGFLERRKETPIVTRYIGDGEAIVISTHAFLDTLGEAREVVSSHLVRAIGMAMPIAEKAIGRLLASYRVDRHNADLLLDPYSMGGRGQDQRHG